MIIFPEVWQSPSAFSLAAAIYLDSYLDNGNQLHLIRRTKAGVRNTKRIPHFDWWSDRMHQKYLELRVTWDLEQFVILDDAWAAATFELIHARFPGSPDAAARIAFYLWERMLFWAQYAHHSYATGYVCTGPQIAADCGCSLNFAIKVVGAMLDAGLIHRKWVGSNYTNRGSCYLPGPKDNLTNLLEKSNMES